MASNSIEFSINIDGTAYVLNMKKKLHYKIKKAHTMVGMLQRA